MAEAFLENIGIAELLPQEYQRGYNAGYTAGRNSMSGEYQRGYSAGYAAGQAAAPKPSLRSQTVSTTPVTNEETGYRQRTRTYTLPSGYLFILLDIYAGCTYVAGYSSITYKMYLTSGASGQAHATSNSGDDGVVLAMTTSATLLTAIQTGSSGTMNPPGIRGITAYFI